MPIPPNRNVGDAGHVNDHNDITDTLDNWDPLLTGVTSNIQTQLDAVGLVYINTFTVTNAANLIQDGIFTSAYPNYLIQVNVVPITVGTDTRIRFRASGADTSTAYFSAGTGSNTAGTNTNYGAVNAAWGFIGITAANTAAERNMSIFTVINPQLNVETVWTGTAFYQDSGGVFINRSFGGFQDASTQFDGIKIEQASGNITATMRVWGIRA